MSRNYMVAQVKPSGRVAAPPAPAPTAAGIDPPASSPAVPLLVFSTSRAHINHTDMLYLLAH